VSIKVLRKGDHKFMITDGHVVSPRAGFELNRLMPSEYKLIINECIANGWLKPVAFMKGSEYTFECLAED
jgi:hypothetical protein